MNFVFQISPYVAPDLVRQVSDALERRTELRSREQFPRMWRVIDGLNGQKASRGTWNRRRRRYRVYGVLLILLGIILFVPGMMDPGELLVPLIAGAAGILAGGLTLWMCGSRKKKKDSRFDRAAEQFLKGLAAPPSAQVRFTEDGMEIAGRPGASYPDFDFVAETRDLFLLTWKEKITLLQKKDLAEGDLEQFRSFLLDNMKEKNIYYRACP